MQKVGTYEKLEESSAFLEKGMWQAGGEVGVEVRSNRVGSMFSVFFNSEEIKDPASVYTSSKERFKAFYSSLLADGTYLSPSPFEASFVSLAHSREEIGYTVQVSRKAFTKAIEAG